MKPVEEIAREIVDAHIGVSSHAGQRTDIAAAIATALRAERERVEKAESALATARNSALEEAAEVAGEELAAYDEEGNDGEVWVVRKIVDAILSLRTKEPTDAK